MNDELFQAEYRTRMTRSMSDEDLAREMYEAGFKAGREELAADQSRVIEALEQEVYRLNNHDMHLDIGGMAEDVAAQCPVCQACERIWAVIHPEDINPNGDEK